MERLMTLKEVARYLGKSERWARMEGRDLGLPLVVIGRSLRCDPAELRKWVHRQR
ncbi:helix-turn-helix domain-containing protein [Nocardiopsis sp. FR4]|nr:helix-turn-helix domain-containing protein [Nocardiopsis sp. FR4]